MRLPLVALTLMASTPAWAEEFGRGDIRIEHPYTHPAPGMVPSAITYMTITNQGRDADRLVGIEAADFDRASLHRTEIVDGIARMLPQSDGVEIPSDETVAFEPNGLHVMLEGLGGDPIELGETFDATLVFERAGRIDIVIAARPRGSSEPMGHEGHETMEESPGRN